MMKNFYLCCSFIFLFAIAAPAQDKTVSPLLLSYTDVSLHKSDTTIISPLQQVAINNSKGNTIKVFDGNRREYFSSSAFPLAHFMAGGALGKQTICIYNQQNKLTDSIHFFVDAKTTINDAGYYKEMFDMFYKGMIEESKTGTFPIEWNGKTYNVFVSWVLDNFHTMKGLQYFLPNGRELIDIMRQSQREDGMIYSFIQYMNDPDYWLTRDNFSGYSKKIGDKVFVRQPVENHPEYVYVNTIYACWKSEGDDAWMKQNLSSAQKALDYALHDPARWSNRFGLLKRAYTIDSWDFAVEDEYMPDLGITNTMIIDPVKTKFGVFFGDNTGYIMACYQLAEMLQRTGDKINAKKYNDRGDTLTKRLNDLAWNGKFFTHFIDEDSSVHRDLGVDEKTQLAQSNAYSINRHITHEQSKAVIESYLHLKDHLPVGSPGEWYAIYPPFQKGFIQHDAVWQYMNGGVGGHVAGELAKGAYNNGYENYATNILDRVFELGKKYDNKVWFAYTGSMEPPPPPAVYTPIDISAFANMDSYNTYNNAAHKWMNGGKPGDDFHKLPTGNQLFDSIAFSIIDPSKNNRNAVIAVSGKSGLPDSVVVPVNKSAACIYLLHTSSKPASENISGAVKIVYEDGSSKLQYIMMGKQLTYWWFSELKTDHSGIAWYGDNDISKGIGLSWCAIDNPYLDKKIGNIVLQSSLNNNIYTVFAITLSNQRHYVPVSPISYGGPDYWAASTNMSALVVGLAGITNAPNTEAFSTPVIAPRWSSAKADSINVTIRFAASKGYAAYQYKIDKINKQIHITSTTGGNKMLFHVLLPQHTKATSVLVNDKNYSFKQTEIEQSSYADFETDANNIQQIVIKYQ